ncbi:MAG: hypothetical protein HY080_16785 [Gammaproteobacteria bacterium]|nr:hypothetical protein [Gammaproteobacteria bacterium]
MRVKVTPSDITVGRALTTDLYNEAGRRIFRRGFIINTEDSRRRVLAMNLHVEVEQPNTTPASLPPQGSPLSAHAQPVSISAADGNTATRRRQVLYDFNQGYTSPLQREGENFFSLLDYCITQEQHICESICQGKTDQCAVIEKLIDSIQQLYAMSPDACLGAIHLDYEHALSCLQPVYMALLCLDVAHGQKLDAATARSLVGAALTADLGMFEYFDVLVNRISALEPEEREYINKHPDISQQLLLANHITDELWLRIVMQHHERSDGSGYPNKLKDNICNEASILGTVVWYFAMIMQRAYQKPLPPKVALLKIYQAAQNSPDQRALLVIKQLGIYPPGSLVRLISQEVAVVLERNPHSSLTPTVACLGLLGGKMYAKPIIRHTSGQNYAIIDAFVSSEPIDLDLNELWGRSISVDLKTVG